ncbi:phosphofructokinase [Actinoplanes sp. SE50]|uniref:1-phosphofructokinase family hexose kinase n=1 Tax=unclassified Actinoplanes TaxID=2626549 RepID=UPI00023ED11C|nr:MULTISPECIES: 1-phosphofructokinase family hexose kinase [unclassified Actinoplanes]AEV87255.1 phosphofructokinase [Actinoplanes sp. SE50/110]ATO85655.1 phosphofructokinase [Actinoplanes sp. SE50]SLM03068.1 phosphofructokinase [Actinoplanes sp. SE50/110]
MILTVTLNPSVDRALEVDALLRGEVLRAVDSHIDPGGKGVNVSRALLANGVRSTAVVPTGGAEGEQLVDLLRGEGVDLVAVPIVGRTRSNITLAEPDGTVTKVNEAGPTLSAAEFGQVSDAVLTAARSAGWVVICGSLPPGPSVADFQALCERLVAAGVRLAVDSSGPGLRAGVTAGAALVKPNREELAEAAGTELATFGDVLEACERLRKAGAGAVLASLGADGAVLVEESGVLAGRSPAGVPRSTVGAGDALLAGFLAAGARGADALIEGLAWGAAAVSLPGSRMPGPRDLDRSTIHIDHDPDPARPLGRD